MPSSVSSHRSFPAALPLLCLSCAPAMAQVDAVSPAAPSSQTLTIVAIAAGFVAAGLVARLLIRVLMKPKRKKPAPASTLSSDGGEGPPLPLPVAAPVAAGPAAAPVRPNAAGPVWAHASIATAAHYLVHGKVSMAIAISPDGDDGSAQTVALAREIARRGRAVLLVDMTASALPTRLMAEEPVPTGITDLLSGDIAFGEAIHRDRLSQAHLVPHGRATPENAAPGLDRLGMIVQALADAYDFVLIECGPARLSVLSRLLPIEDAQLILSLPGRDAGEVDALVAKFDAAGFERPLAIA